MGNKTENKLIFMHIPKNGGTTLDSILDKIYAPSSVFNIRPIDNIHLNHAEFTNLPNNEREKITLLKGHLDFGLHKIMGPNTSYITLLRRPEERVISFYYYVLEKPDHRLYDTVKNGNMSLYDFVTQINQGDINNAQARVISGINDTDERMYEQAITNIDNHFSFIGLVEKFDESMLLLEDTHHLRIPYYKTLNKTSKRVTINEIDKKTRDAIMELNQADIMLYELMEKRFQKNLNQIGGLALKKTRLSLMNGLYNIYSKTFHKD